MSVKVSSSTPAEPPLRRTRLQAPRESPRATPCRSARENAGSGSSLAFACNTVWSSRTFSDPVRFSPVVTPFPLSVSLSNQGSFPPPGITRPPRYYKPIRHPAGPACPSRGSGWNVRSTDRASRVAPAPLFHACRRHYPGGTGRCVCRSLPDPWQPSPKNRRVGFRITRFEACSAFTRVAARMVARPPKAARFTEVLQAMSLPPSPAPIATGWIAGRDSHPLRDGAFPRHTV